LLSFGGRVKMFFAMFRGLFVFNALWVRGVYIVFSVRCWRSWLMQCSKQWDSGRGHVCSISVNSDYQSGVIFS